MKLGFDAKWFFDGPPSGRRVVRGLVRALDGALLPGEELHLFLDERHSHAWKDVDLPRAQQHYVWAGNNQVSNLWNVPRTADRVGLDVVAYQNFTPPRSIARHARIAFLHGTAFRDRPEFFTHAE